MEKIDYPCTITFDVKTSKGEYKHYTKDIQSSSHHDNLVSFYESRQIKVLGIHIIDDTPEVTKRKGIQKIAQSYLGMRPSDKQCDNWLQMQIKMTDEIIKYLNDLEK